MLSAGELAALAVLGGAVGLDRTAFLQAGLARPLVAGSLAGTVVGAPLLGLACGMLLELLWLAEAPVGAFVPPDEALAGVCAAVLAAAAPGTWSAPARVALGVVLAVPCGGLGRWLDMAVRRWNDGLVARARAGVARGERGAVGRAHLTGAARFFLAGAAGAVLLALLGVAAVEWVTARAPAPVERGLELAALLLPAVGAASLLASWRGWRQTLRFAAGAVAWGIAVPLGRLPWQG